MSHIKIRIIRITLDFSVMTVKARRAWVDVLQDLGDHGCQPRLLCLTKQTIINKENKILHYRQKFKWYLFTNLVIQKVLKENLKLQLKNAS